MNSARIGQDLILIISAWNRKIHSIFEKVGQKQRHQARSPDSKREDSGENLSSMDESFEELSSDVFEVANQSERDVPLQGESVDSFISSPLLFLQNLLVSYSSPTIPSARAEQSQ